MKTITIETLSGKTFYIENVGSCFEVQTNTYQTLGHFSDLASALDFVRGKA